jgi:hypothetical protein
LQNRGVFGVLDTLNTLEIHSLLGKFPKTINREIFEPNREFIRDSRELSGKNRLLVAERAAVEVIRGGGLLIRDFATRLALPGT